MTWKDRIAALQKENELQFNALQLAVMILARDGIRPLEGWEGIAVITCDEAFRRGQEIFNSRARAEGLQELIGKDIPILAAHAVFCKAFESVAARSGDDPDFERQAAIYAAKLIATAVIS